MKKDRVALPFDFYVLRYIDNEYTLVLVTTESHFNLTLAKIYAVYQLGFDVDDVPVVVDVRGKTYKYYYYHPRFKCWLKDLSDKELDIYFKFIRDDKLQ